MIPIKIPDFIVRRLPVHTPKAYKDKVWSDKIYRRPRFIDFYVVKREPYLQVSLFVGGYMVWSTELKSMVTIP